MKKRLDENLTNDSVDNSLILGTKKRIVEEVEVDDTMETRQDNWVTNPIFYDSDFKEEGMKEFWEDEFEKAYYLKPEALKAWAKDMLEYCGDLESQDEIFLGDFATYYVRDEVAKTLQRIAETGSLELEPVEECNKTPIKEAESLISKINKEIKEKEAELREKQDDLYREGDEDKIEQLMDEINSLEIEIGELEDYLAEIDYIDNGPLGDTSWFESMEKRLDEEEDDVEVEWEVIWHPADWDMQEHDANIEDFDDFEKYKARLAELKKAEEPVTIVSANSYNKNGDIIRNDLDMQDLGDEFEFEDDDDEFIDESIDSRYPDFLDDEEKMRDFKELSRDEFLKMYSYITPEEYDMTVKALEVKNESLNEKKEKVLTDLWFEHHPEFNNLLIKGELPNGKTVSLADIEVDDDFDAEDEKQYEDAYNLALETVHDLGYVLEGEIDESLKEAKEEEEEVEVKETEKISNPLDELPDTIEPIFEFESGNYVFIDWDANSKSLIAGGATNTGIIPEFEHKYDFDVSLEDNLQELYDKIIAEHPDYLNPVDGEDEVEKVEVEDKVEVEEESLNEADKPAATSMEDCQKWVDYDMKHYGKISKNTNDIVKKAGFQIIKDDHGDYEVAAGKFESMEEAFKVGDEVEVFTNSQDGEDWIKYKIKEVTPEGKYILDMGDEKVSTPVEAKNLRKPEIKEAIEDIRPTEEQKQLGLDDGWDDFEVEHGYGIFQVGWNYAPLDIVCRIDDMDVFPDDLEAVEQAKRDGYKFIDFGTSKDDFFDDFFDILPEQILDTEENRKNLEKYYMHENEDEEDVELHLATSDLEPGQWYESYLKEEKDLSKIEGTISKYLDDNSAELFAGIVGDSNKDRIKLAQNAIDLLQKAIDKELISKSEIPHAKENIMKINNDLRHNKLKGIMGLVTSLLTGKALNKPVDEDKKCDTMPIEKEEKKMMDEKIKVVEEERPDADDEEGSPKQKYWDKLEELEHYYSDDAYTVIETILNEADLENDDIGDWLNQEIDNACIYYKDCWDYLWNQNITDFEEAIAEGATGLTSIAYHYLAEEVYELASKIGLEW